jgi:uncharacterized membrane protein
MPTSFWEFLFGLKDARSIQAADITFAEHWAASAPAWVLFGCVAMASLGVLSYVKFEPRIKGGRRFWVAPLRAAVLAMLFFIAADPILKVVYREEPRPLVYLLFDCTDSMNIRDKLDSQEEQALRQATGMSALPKGDPPTRMDYLKAMLGKPDDDLVARLSKKCRLRAFAIGQQGIQSLKLTDAAEGNPSGPFIASALNATAPITKLGTAIDDLTQDYSRENLAGVVMFSDFNNNSGPEPVAAARRLGRPIHTVGLGPAATKDLTVRVSASPVLKKAEREMIIVTLVHDHLDGQTAKVSVEARPLNADGGDDKSRPSISIGRKSVKLEGREMIVEFPWPPEDTGRFRLVAEAEQLAAESVKENNVASREVNVRDDFMRLLYVAYEPNWEWRFIKEVFHRDKLVGMPGFRTFLYSSDPDVRRSNPLFTRSLDMQRSEFFANDVIFLGDVPAVRLTPQFCEMVKEFVGDFGGGLVVIAGPVYGPGQLAQTALADMLPVVIDPKASRRDDRKGFRLRLTPSASNFGFMQLGDKPEENSKAWENMGLLPWYHPAKKVDRQADVLAIHPKDTCDDGKPQPIIAIRRYGKGEVIYVAFDETWRLRRLFGEKYYRQFWGQMIYRLGLGHATGSQKRFVVSTDRTHYPAGKTMRLTIDAYDEEFHPLTRDKLEATVFFKPEGGKPRDPRQIEVPILREGKGGYELSMPLLEPGDYRIRVKDSVTNEYSDVVFAVIDASEERQSARRNVSLEENLAGQKNGKVYDLKTVAKLPDELEFSGIEKTSVSIFPLSSTWLCFLLLGLLAVGEWVLRKRINVP